MCPFLHNTDFCMVLGAVIILVLGAVIVLVLGAVIVLNRSFPVFILLSQQLDLSDQLSV